MEKAEELFISLGYKAVSVEDIAAAAGISKMTIYKYFTSKEELFMGVVLSIMDKTYRSLEEELNKIPDTLQKINFLMGYNMEASRGYSIAFYKDILSVPYITEKILEEKYRISKIMFGSIIKEGIEKGEIRKVNVGFVTDMLIMITEGFAKTFLSKINNQEDIEGIIKDFYDFLKYGLLGGDGVKE